MNLSLILILELILILNLIVPFKSHFDPKRYLNPKPGLDSKLDPNFNIHHNFIPKTKLLRFSLQKISYQIQSEQLLCPWA